MHVDEFNDGAATADVAHERHRKADNPAIGFAKQNWRGKFRYHGLSIRTIILAAGFCLPVSVCYAQSPQQYVRVAIIQDAKSLSLKIIGNYEVTDSKNGALLYKGSNLKTTVTDFRNEILLGAIRASGRGIFVKTASSGEIIINGRRFRGDIELARENNGRLLVINYISLEDYIKGILYHEVSHYWPMEALQAQAIVSRTYAVYQCEENKGKDFDVKSNVYSQVYGGRTSERLRTNKAVEDTAGKVVTFKGKVIPAFFHSTCAGHTEDASLLWDINMPVLKGVTCGFCKDSPHFNWHFVVFSGEVRERLVKAGYKIGVIKAIEPLGKDASGRITDIKMASLKEEIKIAAKDFRNIIGPNDIKSANFEVKLVNSDIVFEGIGWGHGVGLCQWGAYFMAKEGFSAQDILKYYYPGAELETLKF